MREPDEWNVWEARTENLIISRVTYKGCGKDFQDLSINYEGGYNRNKVYLPEEKEFLDKWEMLDSVPLDKKEWKELKADMRKLNIKFSIDLP